MARDDLLAVLAIQIHSPHLVHFTTISSDAYRKLFSSIDKSIASRMTFPKPKELRISSDVMSLAKELKGILSSTRKGKCHTLLVEMLDKEADSHTYDDLCDGIYLALTDKNATHPWCITIAVSNHKGCQESVLLEKRLIPFCKSKNIGLIMLSDDPKFRPAILCQGKLRPMGELPPLSVIIREETKKRLTTDEIEAEFQVLFGHFEVDMNNSAFHVPAIAAVKKLARNAVFVKQLKDDVSQILSASKFTILTFGIPGGGINELAIALADGDTKKICDPQKIREHDGNPILILCDFLCPVYPIEATIRDIRAKNDKQIAMVGIARYRNFPDLPGTQSLSYIDTNYWAVPASELAQCIFCKQNVQSIKGEHFEFFARAIKQFDPLTFWEFINQSASFYKVGHWVSTRTPNHYLFTIVADPIFKRHSYGLAVRLRNIIESNKIHSSWIRKIVCTSGEESTALSIAVSEVLGLQQKDVIRIPRKFFNSIAGKQIDPELQKYITAEYGDNVLNRRNVLIIDQAAHHFKTMSSLRDICEYYDCTVMAFAVFLDRTDTALSLGEYLHDSNYFPLYSWPVPPRRAHECPCIKEIT
jgi:hypothetical protein